MVNSSRELFHNSPRTVPPKRCTFWSKTCRSSCSSVHSLIILLKQLSQVPFNFNIQPVAYMLNGIGLANWKSCCNFWWANCFGPCRVFLSIVLLDKRVHLFNKMILVVRIARYNTTKRKSFFKTISSRDGPKKKVQKQGMRQENSRTLSYYGTKAASSLVYKAMYLHP